MDPDRPLTEPELENLRQNLAKLSEDSVRREYNQAWEECRLKHSRLPSPKAVQRLVQAWKQLWKWR